MTAQSTDVVIEAFTEAAKAETVEDFLKDVSHPLFSKYPPTLQFIVTIPIGSTNPLEGRIYRDCDQMVRELCQQHRDFVLRAWPHVFKRWIEETRDIVRNDCI
jgi:hypothetical protein